MGLLRFIQGAWRRLPLETVCVGVAAGAAIHLGHGGRSAWAGRALLGALVLAPLAVAAHRLARRTQLALGLVAGAALLGLLTATLPTLDAVDRPAFGWPYGLSLLGAALVPFVAAAPRFVRFVRRFFEQTTTFGLLCLGALAAVFVVGLALRELFDLRIESFVTDAAVLVTAAFVLQLVDRLVDDDRADAGRMPELWRRLATTVGAPFVAAMLVILVVYEASVLARGELPKNVLSPLIIAAGFVGFLSSLILASVAGEEVATAALAQADPHPWLRRRTIRLARAFPLVLLALLPLAGWALVVRLEQHGFTPFRAVRLYGLLCLAVLSLAGIARWARGRALGWEVPAAILVFALAAAFGPTSAVN